MKWLGAVPPEALCVSVLSLGELQKGISLQPANRKRATHEAWLENILMNMADGNLVPVDSAVARKWGGLTAAARLEGRTLAIVDALLAATALVHDLTVVTRNARDFAGLGVRVLNPWKQ
jgi:predicted nucleic acid-binding protein